MDEAERKPGPTRDQRPDETREEQIDAALEDSFPASDPPSYTPVTGTRDAPEHHAGEGEAMPGRQATTPGHREGRGV
jgi:hypothetical protein